MKDFLKNQPAHTLASVLAVPGAAYCIYLADARELSEPGAGTTISGAIALDMPASRYEASFFSPETGGATAPRPLEGSANCRVDLPEFRHDIVVRITRRR